MYTFEKFSVAVIFCTHTVRYQFSGTVLFGNDGSSAGSHENPKSVDGNEVRFTMGTDTCCRHPLSIPMKINGKIRANYNDLHHAPQTVI